MSGGGGGGGGGGGAGAGAGGGAVKTPADFLKSIRGRPVVVKLNSGVDYRGILACLDGYMNIAMEQTEEYVNGQLKNKYGDAFIRGNNVLYISTSKRTLAEGIRERPIDPTITS
ncbi:U6 snRNA-associated Sm-like protein LSm6 [Ananas comosus]|uniref:Sm-like protein LSM36B n=1 Tax=Ananas comosus TaxID=4615 RepID=A0A199UU78_ANACO|nr:U6 snRNA-associated Sm-like protein LSm6 [Ananas comosus]OAY68319.1 Sm-like protein LSM36B [Ananas comosus]